MTKLLEVYKCDICGNIIEVTHASQGTLVCCSQNMTLLSENTTDAAQEKHVPVIEKTADGILVKVGSVDHPMADDHYIEWIELIVDNNKSYTQFLKPGEKPQALFNVTGSSFIAREFCNVHGHWKSEA